jgi:response regulator RpfG family c-di-GMP phosphodiesterase
MKKILVIEHDGDTLELLEQFLHVDYEVIISSETLSIPDILALNPSLILLDHWKYTTEASVFCLQLKATNSTSRIPVVMTSVHPSIRQIANKSHANCYMEKPFDLTDLKQVIDGYLN